MILKIHDIRKINTGVLYELVSRSPIRNCVNAARAAERHLLSDTQPAYYLVTLAGTTYE